MKSFIGIASLILLVLLTTGVSRGLEESGLQDILIKELSESAGKYEGNRITLKLKFKQLDNVFDKLFFYDRKNHDIVFDIAIQVTMPEFRNELINLHEGMDYYVTFLFNGVGNIGMIDAELIRFTPVILTKLP